MIVWCCGVGMYIEVSFTIETDEFVPETLRIVADVLAANGVSTRDGIVVRNLSMITSTKGDDEDDLRDMENKTVRKVSFQPVLREQLSKTDQGHTPGRDSL